MKRVVIAGIVGGFLFVMGDGAFARDPNPVRPDRSRTQEVQISLGVCDPGVVGLPGFVSEEWAGQGNVTHGGRSSVHLCIVVTDVQSLSPLVFKFAGQGTVTGANGDVVFLKIVNGLTNVDAGCLGTSTVEFAGGTGRFEQASGAVDCLSVRATPCGPSQTTTCVGSISY